MALNANEVQALYVAYLGRPADEEGLQYWTTQVPEEFTLADLRYNLVNLQPEYQELYGDLSREDLVAAIYQNMFDRAPDAAGLDYWVNGGGASVPADELMQLFISAAGEEDSAVFNNKVEAAETEPTDPQEPGNTTDIVFNTSLESTPGALESDGNGGWVFVEGQPADIVGETISHIGLDEWNQGATTTSADYTFNLSNQLGAHKTYEGLFLSPLLTSDTITSNSQLFVELLDVRSVGDGSQAPLTNLPIDGFSFNLDGSPVVLRDISIYEANTYQQLVDAINAVIDATPALAGFSAEIGATFVADDGEDPIPGAIGETIVLTDANGRDISGGTFTYTDQVTGGFTLYGELSNEAPVSDQLLIETSLDLDNVGYGSQGGTVNLAGESNSDKGIELFDVTANNGVWLTRLESQAPGGDHFLKEVNVTGSGYLNIGIQDGGADKDQDVLGLQELGALNNAGLIDVQKFNGTGFVGDIKLNAYISDAVIERDLQADDTQDDPTAEDVTYAYQTAGGDDQISLAVDEALLARADSQLVINAGNGNNVVETAFVDAFGQLVNQQLNGNVTIITGNGNDVVRTWGGDDAVINTGAGNDVVYADNSGLGLAVFGPVADLWEFNSTGTADTGATGVSNSDASLSSGANDVAQTFNVVSNANVQVQVAFKGFESVWVDVPTTRTSNADADDTITTLQVNQAIKNAVNEHAVLQNLIEASDGNGNILNIESLIDGNNLDQLGVSFRNNNDNATADLGDIEAIYAVDSAATNFGGTASDAESDNTINAGAGNDVIVLGTGAESNDTLVLEGSFGNDSIVNFTAGEVNGADILDFTDYGVNGATLGADYIVENDEVNVVDFSASDFDRSDVSFGNLTAADVKTAIGDEVAENRIDSIILVESGDTGRYKAFDVNSANDSTDFTVDLVGVLDFGASQAFVADNFA